MTKRYAILPSRVKAAFIDSLVLVAMMYAASEFLNILDEVPNTLRWVIIIIVFFLYDPLLTHIFGATMGQSHYNIGVRLDNDTLNKKLSLPLSFLRFFFKATLGWISLLTVTGNSKRKALHDFIAKSIVIEIPEEE